MNSSNKINRLSVSVYDAFKLHLLAQQIESNSYTNTAVLCSPHRLKVMKDYFCDILSKFPEWYYKIHKPSQSNIIKYDFGIVTNGSMVFASNASHLRGISIKYLFVFDGMDGWQDSIYPIVSISGGNVIIVE